MNSKISEKDKKTWEEFLSKDQKLPNKDNFQSEIKSKKTRSLDLHGKTLDESNQIIDNAKELIAALIKLKPSSSKGTYFKSVTISSTMSPGVKIEPKSVEV